MIDRRPLSMNPHGPLDVMPANPGIQCKHVKMDSRFRGNDDKSGAGTHFKDTP
jgi:hypothetical protein